MKFFKKLLKIIIGLLVLFIVGVWLFSKTYHPNYNDEIKSLAIKWSLQRGNRNGRTGWQFIIQLASDRNLQLNF